MKGNHRTQGIRAVLPALGILVGAVVPWGIYCGFLLSQEVVEADMAIPFEIEETEEIEEAQEPSQSQEDTLFQGEKLVALTFDDGPKRSTTIPLLDGLSQRGVQATFFLIGAQIEGNEDIILRMEEEGHQIGLHTYDHMALTDLNQVDFDNQVEQERTLLTSILNYSNFMLRPPYGLYDEATQLWADSAIILWSVDPEDWKDKTAEEIAQAVLSQVGDGDIILLHDIFETSVEAALLIVDDLLAQDYHLCTIEDLFHEKHITTESGAVYWKAIS